MAFGTFVWATEIEYSREVSGEITAKSFESKIVIEANEKSFEFIKKGFDSLLEKLKAQQSVCAGGEYSLYPNYKYDKGEREFIGYLGRIEFDCKFETADTFDDAVETMESALDKEVFKIRILPIKPFIPDVDYKKEVEALEKTVIKKSVQYAKELENEFGFKCEHKNIRLYSQEINIPYRAYDTSAEITLKVASPTQIPIEPKKSVNVRGDFVLKCE